MVPLPFLLQASDTHSTSRILVAVVKMCFEAKSWDALNDNIVLFTKKRGQIKQVKRFRILKPNCLIFNGVNHA